MWSNLLPSLDDDNHQGHLRDESIALIIRNKCKRKEVSKVTFPHFVWKEVWQMKGNKVERKYINSLLILFETKGRILKNKIMHLV